MAQKPTYFQLEFYYSLSLKAVSRLLKQQRKINFMDF